MNAPQRFLVGLSCIALGLVSSRIATAENWTQFRGSTQAGITEADGLPTTWSEEKNVAWKAALPGLGWSSPIVVNGRIYVTAAVPVEEGEAALSGSQQLRLLAVDAETGRMVLDQLLLDQGVDSPRIHAKNSHASPTPLSDGERLYLHFGHQGMVCTDLEGKLLWIDRDHPYAPTHGNGASPILVGEHVVVTCDGGDRPGTIALDRKTGREVWRCDRAVDASKRFSFCTPTAIEVDGQTLVISPGSDIVQALRPDDGTVVWSVKYEGFSVVPKPLYHRGRVLICTGFGPTSLLCIDPTGRGDVTDTHVVWKIKSQNVPETPSLVAIGDQVIMASDDGIASAVDLATGDELWKKRLGGNYSASPLVAGDRVYFQSEQGEASNFRVGERPGEVNRAELPGRVFASYAIIDSDLLIRTEHALYRISGE